MYKSKRCSRLVASRRQTRFRWIPCIRMHHSYSTGLVLLQINYNNNISLLATEHGICCAIIMEYILVIVKPIYRNGSAIHIIIQPCTIYTVIYTDWIQYITFYAAYNCWYYNALWPVEQLYYHSDWFCKGMILIVFHVEEM